MARPGTSPAGSTQRAPERERLLRRLAVILSLFIAFVIAEVGLRVYARFSNYIPKVDLYDAPHHYLGRALIPNARYAGGSASIHINSRGFRGADFDLPKPEGTYRIFALGGSTTFGYYPATSADDQTYPAILQARLNDENPLSGIKRYEVVNAGVPGYSLRTSLQNLAARVLFLQPDMVVVYHLTNDLARYGNEENLRYPLLNQFVDRGVLSGFADGLMGWSWAFQELRFTLGARLWGGLVASRKEMPKHSADWRPDERYLEVFRRDLRNLVILAKANGVVPVLATQSIAFTDKTDFENLTDDEKRMQFDKPAIFYAAVPPAQRHALFRRYNDIIRSVAREEGTLFADVDAAIPKTPVYHYDYCHLTDAGSALQAEIIFRAIRDAAPRIAGRQ